MKLIKYFLVIFAILLLNTSVLVSQIDTGLAKKFKLDFTVPDFPAFKILGIEKSNLLKPSITDMVAFIASQIQNPGGISIPSSYAAEVSPMMLFNLNNITVNDFRKNYALYSTRISIGTTKDDSNQTNHLGIGIRITPICDGDLRKNKAYQKEISKYLKSLLVKERLFEKEFFEIHRESKYNTESPETIAYVKEELKKSLEKYLKDNPLYTENSSETKDYLEEKRVEFQSEFLEDNPKYTEDSPETQEYIKQRVEETKPEDVEKFIEKTKKKYQEKYWNAKRLDFAIAWLGNTPDSLSNVKAEKYALWCTFAVPLSSWGQIMLGGNYNYVVTNKIENLSFNTRLYAGINRAKAFIEGQYGLNMNGNEYTFANGGLLNLGAELSLFDGFWITYYAGMEFLNSKSDKNNRFDSHFDFRYTLP